MHVPFMLPFEIGFGELAWHKQIPQSPKYLIVEIKSCAEEFGDELPERHFAIGTSLPTIAAKVGCALQWVVAVEAIGLCMFVSFFHVVDSPI